VLTRQFVVEKLGLGDLRQRDLMLNAMSNLLGANIDQNVELLHFINRHGRRQVRTMRKDRRFQGIAVLSHSTRPETVSTLVATGHWRRCLGAIAWQNAPSAFLFFALLPSTT
jgi:hypothetical protein